MRASYSPEYALEYPSDVRQEGLEEGPHGVALLHSHGVDEGDKEHLELVERQRLFCKKREEMGRDGNS